MRVFGFEFLNTLPYFKGKNAQVAMSFNIAGKVPSLKCMYIQEELNMMSKILICYHRYYKFSLFVLLEFLLIMNSTSK